MENEQNKIKRFLKAFLPLVDIRTDMNPYKIEVKLENGECPCCKTKNVNKDPNSPYQYLCFNCGAKFELKDIDIDHQKELMIQSSEISLIPVTKWR